MTRPMPVWRRRGIVLALLLTVRGLWGRVKCLEQGPTPEPVAEKDDG